MPKYNVRSPIKWKGERITEGEVELTEKVAKPLLEAGAVESAAAPAGASGSKAEKAEAKK